MTVAVLALLGSLVSFCLVAHYTFAGFAALENENRKEYANIVLHAVSGQWKSFPEIRYSVHRLGKKLSDGQIKKGLDHLLKMGLVQEKREQHLVRDFQIPFVWYRKRCGEQA